MSNQKSIVAMIHKPMDAVRKIEITSDAIDLVGEISSLVVDAGEYRSLDMMNAKLSQCSAMNVISYRASLIRCSFTKCRLTGLQLPDAHIKDAVFEDCLLELSNFRNVQFERCHFKNCDLREADFAGSNLKNVLFENCEFAGVDFSNASCARVEFEETNLSEIKGISGLKGATMTEQNLIEIAPLLAREWGIKY